MRGERPTVLLNVAKRERGSTKFEAVALVVRGLERPALGAPRPQIQEDPSVPAPHPPRLAPDPPPR